MKIYVIIMLATFYSFKLAVYCKEYMSKKGYVSDYGYTLTIILPIISMLMYAGCIYVLYEMPIGFVVTDILAWLMLIVSMAVVRHLSFSFCYIKGDDNNDCYKVASGVVNTLKARYGDIVYDDNIGMSTSIKIEYNSKKLTRAEMDDIIDEQYRKTGARKKINRISLLYTMVHAVELVFDVSFLVSIAMM